MGQREQHPRVAGVGVGGPLGAQSPAPGAPVDVAAPAPQQSDPATVARSVAPADGSTNDLDRILSRLDGEEKAMRTELDGIAPKLEVTGWPE